ncbi:hypothetical protein ATO67_17015, partial [Agrobacterium bohemicum]
PVVAFDLGDDELSVHPATKLLADASIWRRRSVFTSRRGQVGHRENDTGRSETGVLLLPLPPGGLLPDPGDREDA